MCVKVLSVRLSSRIRPAIVFVRKRVPAALSADQCFWYRASHDGQRRWRCSFMFSRLAFCYFVINFSGVYCLWFSSLGFLTIDFDLVFSFFFLFRSFIITLVFSFFFQVLWLCFETFPFSGSFLFNLITFLFFFQSFHRFSFSAFNNFQFDLF